MEEIKVGEYVRTKDGYIGKYVKDLTVKWVIEIEDNEMTFPTGKHNIKKHSFNILDLIEIGDYVNGYKVLEIADSIYPNSKRIKIYENYKEEYERWIYIQEYNGRIRTQDDIKSIVTHEQFASVEYKIN